MNKQIEEMATIISNYFDGFITEADIDILAHTLHSKGYCKQSEGEWTRVEVNGKNYGQVYYQHKDCEVNETQLFPSPYNFCPNCGAKMKGGE